MPSRPPPLETRDERQLPVRCINREHDDAIVSAVPRVQKFPFGARFLPLCSCPKNPLAEQKFSVSIRTSPIQPSLCSQNDKKDSYSGLLRL